MALKRVAELDLDDDVRFHERSWRVQRVGWAALALFVLAALAGLFGTGPLSTRTVTAPGGALNVEHERFARYDAPIRMRIEFAPANGQRQVPVSVAKSYLESVQIERITPEPVSVESSGDEVIYLFSVADAAGPASAVFHLKTQRVGHTSGRISLLNGPSVTFDQFVYP